MSMEIPVLFRRLEEGLNLRPLFRVLLVAILTVTPTVVVFAYKVGQLETETGMRLDRVEEIQLAQKVEQGEQKNRLEAIQERLNNMHTSQQVLKQRFDDKEKNDKAFQERTDKGLARIIEKLDDRDRRHGWRF